MGLGVQKGFLAEYIYIKMVSAFLGIAVQQCHQVINLGCLLLP